MFNTFNTLKFFTENRQEQNMVFHCIYFSILACDIFNDTSIFIKFNQKQNVCLMNQIHI